MNMKRLVCALIVKDDKVFACRSQMDDTKWCFPYSDIPHQVVGESMKRSLDGALVGDYKMRGGSYYPDPIKDVEMTGTICSTQNGDFKLVVDRESRWFTKDEIDGVEWEPLCSQIAVQLRDDLEERKFKIKKRGESGAERTIYSGCLSRIERDRKFSEYIAAYSEEYRRTKKFAQFRIYNEFGNIVGQETF